MRMRQVSSLFVALLVCGTGQAADVDKSAPGWCAAAVAPVQSRATIFCSDVEAAALDRLNELLDAMRLTFVEKRAQAEPWARQYRDLKQRLNLLSDNDPPLPVLQRLVANGRFEEASALLEDTLNSRRLSRSQRSEYRFAVARTYRFSSGRARRCPTTQRPSASRQTHSRMPSAMQRRCDRGSATRKLVPRTSMPSRRPVEELAAKVRHQQTQRR